MYSIIKNVFLLVCLALDIIGIIIVYVSDILIPNYVYITILIIGFILANFKLYINNLPDISLNLSLLNKYPYKVKAADSSYLSIMVNYNFYICNSSENAGIIEKVDVEMVKCCNIKDEFLLNKVGVAFKEYFVSDKEIFTPLEFLKNKTETKFPIMLKPKSNINKVLILYIDIDCFDEDEYEKTIQWMNDIEFKISITTLNNNVKNIVSCKQLVSKKDIELARKEYITSNADVNKYLESLNNE